MLVLAGDIGGTKTWLQAFDTTTARVWQHKYVSSDFSGLAEMILRFRQDNQLGMIAAACFGLAGPVAGRVADLTNLPWRVDANELQSLCHIERVELLNDFQAAALGIDALAQDELIVLHQGEFDARGNRLVVGAGTGLGVAPVVQCGGRFLPQPGEGGHMDFAPIDSEQQAILQWCWSFWSHVSYERLLCGAGLAMLYAYFADLPRDNQQAWLAPPMIQPLAEQGDEAARRALNTFVRIYGAYIGNVALLWPARAGVYIAGGIASKIEGWMRDGTFLQALHDKGRMHKLVASMPIYLVKDELLGLKGAMLRAQEMTNI
ncbi:MAG: glucokinase [Thiomicrospira sp.]|jgi:glucokinase|nr:glucokinase [Thiomicrospira sp.]